MKKPNKLKVGDTIAAISLSSGMAGEADILWRYQQGKQQLSEMGFNIVELEYTLAGLDAVYHHPKGRAHDLHTALLDPNINAIIATIGGIESYRLFEYLDLNILRENPKAFIGYSDSTSIHQMFQLAGVVSFYGPCLLVDFAENGGAYPFTKESFKKVLMEDSANYCFPWRDKWTSHFLPWHIDNKDTLRDLCIDEGPLVLQGEGVVEGRLIGGCLDVLAMLRGTDLYPTKEAFKDGLLLLETSEMYPDPALFEIELRTMGVMGVLQELNGILIGKPQDNKYFKEYQTSIVKVLKEFQLEKLPVLYNGNFGHTEPKWTLPLGVKAQLDLDHKTFMLLEKATT
ncbi:S66 family peptidase [Amphibacillus sp. Q70]|uniref:S66 family peptidase n=1 Tax=Amphibacillus sp. Q70 TaxID=3453416 RepID=UPI003F8690E4